MFVVIVVVVVRPLRVGQEGLAGSWELARLFVSGACERSLVGIEGVVLFFVCLCSGWNSGARLNGEWI